MLGLKISRGSFARRGTRQLAAWTLLFVAIAGFCGDGASAQDASDVSVSVAPPELPDYDQPPIPGDGYVWTPGYWAWSDDDQDYYWVPGTWVAAPVIGYLWTPGYWFGDGGLFVWYPGYWGPHVGFYGGVNYGHGYGGRGYEGGYWQGSHLFYNRAASNIGTAPIGNVYNSPIVSYNAVNRSSFNGAGGIQVQASPAELAAARETHLEATVQQRQHEDAARATPALRAAMNRGVPPVAATARPGQLSGAGAVAARRGATAPSGGGQLLPGGAEIQGGEASSSRAPSASRSMNAPGAPTAVHQAPAPPVVQRPAPPRPPAPKPKDEHDHREP